jgi:hypothetical protein
VQKHQEEADAREFNDLLTAAIGEAKGKNAKSIIANLDVDALKSSKNRDKDIKAAIAKIKEDCDYLFDADDGGTPPAKFTGGKKGNGSNGGGKLTREEIMAIPDRAARRDAIAKNQHLFQ